MPDTELETTEYKLFFISEYAKRDKNMQFTSLAHLLNIDSLRKSFRSLKKNKALGLDNISWYEYAENLEER